MKKKKKVLKPYCPDCAGPMKKVSCGCCGGHLVCLYCGGELGPYDEPPVMR